MEKWEETEETEALTKMPSLIASCCGDLFQHFGPRHVQNIRRFCERLGIKLCHRANQKSRRACPNDLIAMAQTFGENRKAGPRPLNRQCIHRPPGFVANHEICVAAVFEQR